MIQAYRRMKTIHQSKFIKLAIITLLFNLLLHQTLLLIRSSNMYRDNTRNEDR